MLRLNNMDRWALAADALRMIDAQEVGRSDRRVGEVPHRGLRVCCREGL